MVALTDSSMTWLVLVALLLAGCGATRVFFDELNAAYNGDDCRRDNYVCRRDASYVVDGAVKYDRTLYQMCMESKGSQLSPGAEVHDTPGGDVDARSGFRVVPHPGAPQADMEATEAAKLDLVAPDQRGRHGVEDRLHDDGGLALRHHEASGQLFDQDRLDHPKPPKEGASAVARRSVDSGFPTPTQCPRPGRRQCHACRAPGQPPAVSALPGAARQVAFRPTTTPHRSNRRRILRHSTRAPARGVRAANDPVGWPPRGPPSGRAAERLLEVCP